MKVFILLVACFVGVLAVPSPKTVKAVAEECTDAKCKRENGCVCTKVSSPLELKDTPQFVVLSFDESVSAGSFKLFYEPLLFDRKNPTSEHISGTFFVPHVYTDYEKVNQLYRKGFEIGDHSVTKYPEVEYWSKATVELLTKEFKDQKTILSHFANIPAKDIIGARIPYLQLSGNKSIKALVNAELSYDNSWTTNAPIYPYTLDYLSTQQCLIGECPNEPFKGFWVNPVINLRDTANNQCNSLLGCTTKNGTSEIYNWLVEQFNVVYKGQKAPITFLLSSAWFQFGENNFAAFKQFLDHLKTLKDVFLVSQSEVIAWQKKPVALDKFKQTIKPSPAACASPVTCPLPFGEHEIRYMRSCAPCPTKYPWLDNPLGKA